MMSLTNCRFNNVFYSALVIVAIFSLCYQLLLQNIYRLLINIHCQFDSAAILFRSNLSFFYCFHLICNSKLESDYRIHMGVGVRVGILIIVVD